MNFQKRNTQFQVFVKNVKTLFLDNSFIKSIIRFFENIKRIIIWFPVIWKDRDFDYNYFFEITRFKLIQMRDFFQSENALSMDASKDSKEMDLCIKIINRILNDDYYSNAFMWHDKKWGELDTYTEDSETKPGYKTLEFNRENCKTQEDWDKEIRESAPLYKLSDKQKEQDVEYLFKILQKHILKWWD